MNSLYEAKADLQRGRPSACHEYLRSVLDGIAILSGFTDNLQAGFPDGRRPDVLRLDSPSNALFVGDAKASESPDCCATATRLLDYFVRSKPFVAGGRTLMFAICCRRGAHSEEWRQLLVTLCLEVGLAPTHSGHDRLDEEVNLAWVVVRPVA